MVVWAILLSFISSIGELNVNTVKIHTTKHNHNVLVIGLNTGMLFYYCKTKVTIWDELMWYSQCNKIISNSSFHLGRLIIHIKNQINIIYFICRMSAPQTVEWSCSNKFTWFRESFQGADIYETIIVNTVNKVRHKIFLFGFLGLNVNSQVRACPTIHYSNVFRNKLQINGFVVYLRKHVHIWTLWFGLF